MDLGELALVYAHIFLEELWRVGSASGATMIGKGRRLRELADAQADWMLEETEEELCCAKRWVRGLVHPQILVAALFD
jgi:hypothetical protein